MRDIRTYIKIAAVALFVIALLSYTSYQSRFLITGPRIKVETPENGMASDKNLVYVSGTASNVSFIYLNDRQIFTDEEGNFREILLASPGYNIMTLRAKDTLGREKKVSREFIYNAPAATSTSTSTLHR